jgi:hypothetical protein
MVPYCDSPGIRMKRTTPGQSSCSIVKVGINFGINYGMGFGIYKRMGKWVYSI